ncbi:MAG: beta-N-acetylhexosaminidase [Candidatus Syntrophosphaera sp.]|nr:beta-N-acetylhexosaminidase [Candidatus Syntrophosphaera sp.]
MIPQPKKMRVFKEKFWITEKVSYLNATLMPGELYLHLVKDLEQCYHKMFGDLEMDDDNLTVVDFFLAPFKKKVPPEYYELSIKPYRITLTAENPAGLLHGVQTLKQHWWDTSFNFEFEGDSGVDMQCLKINDWPSYPWRGLHLDVSRHFFAYKFIYRYLDWMASYKLNKFHWHLSDDQGWRIESKRFPRLHEAGAWRIEADGKRYGGFYTQRQIKLVVEYAARRGIEVIPEIDLPGHAQAILAAYPELACFPGDFQTLSVWGISSDIICAGKDSAIDFLKELLSEVAELFPGEYFHLGGDEAPKDRWKDCPHCQKRIAARKLADEEQLQGWLFQTLAKHLQDKGKTVIGWDEVLDGKIDSRPIVMCWRGDGIDAARKAHDNGNRYVICPNNKLYFDWKLDDFAYLPGAHGVTTIEDVYSLDLSRYRFEKEKLFLGGQANLWTEYVPDGKTAKDLLIGRIAALSELFWSDPQAKDFEEFIQRVWDSGNCP